MSSSTDKDPLSDLLHGQSQAISDVRDQVTNAIAEDVPVLIEGERGTGRERVARVIHQSGARCARRFVVLMTDEPPADIDRTFSKADGGTILVKDIACADRSLERRLLKSLRARSRGEENVRLVGVTSIDLSRAVADELFDSELFQQLSLRKIVLVPLRRRSEDIAQLASRFAREAGEELGRGKLAIASRAVDRLAAYSWPGNVAELKDVIGRAAFRAHAHRSAKIEPADVDAELPTIEERVPLEQLSFEEMVRAKIRGLLDRMAGYPVEDLYTAVIERVERPLIELVLSKSEGSQLKAAKVLGLDRNTLRKKMAQLGLKPRRK